MNDQQIPTTIADAAVGLLSQFVPGLTADKLQSALYSDATKKSELLRTRLETAKILHVSIPTIDRMLRDGALSKVTIRGAVRIPQSAIDAILKH